MNEFSPQAATQATHDALAALRSRATDIEGALDLAQRTADHLTKLRGLGERHGRNIQAEIAAKGREQGASLQSLAARFADPGLARHWAEYVTDAAQRTLLFCDILRQRGNNFVHHEEQGCPPVLHYDYDMIVDGRTLARPVNYALVRIVPPEGHPETRENGRPYIIIDPRAGHGSGIGGFKSESEVGCALRDGHPVYFVIFFTHPEPGQTLADVTRAEAHFVREVQHRHPDSPRPIVVGNCQGGWAAMLLAATNPDITGPVVVNGAPLSYWSGKVGCNPMRYTGGMVGGVLPVLLLSDLGHGQFDGANLVLNFESLNPANTWWTKYYDVFSKVDSEAPRYLDFERWWSGFYFMNENEIRWIVDNLFVGNRLARGEANLDARTHVDLRNVRSPIIVFASHGDNITPPQQALNWIADCYKDVQEIKARGQRILYTVHDSIGHLGIFVSSRVAKKEHKEIVSTLKTIQSLAPGLYEMVIEDVQGEGVDKTFTVSFQERSIDDILALDDDRLDEEAFANVSRLSDIGAELYDLTWRPWIQALSSEGQARALRAAHPLRQRRYFFSDKNPMMSGLSGIAQALRNNRKPAAATNPFLALERLWAQSVTDAWNLYRDSRDAWMELAFFGLYGAPAMQRLGAPRSTRISEAPQEDLRSLTTVRHAIENMDHGGYGEAVVRMLILLAKSRGGVRRDRLEKSNHFLATTEPFASLSPVRKVFVIHQQSLVVEFEPEAAIETLPKLLSDPEDRRRALAACEDIAGPSEEMDPRTVALFARLHQVLGEPAALPVNEPEAAPAKPRRRRKTTADSEGDQAEADDA